MTASAATAETNGSDGGLRDVRVAIIGAGFGGLGVAIKLREAGFDDFLVLERDEALGGTWWANTYPGCACDVPAHLYSYSFQLNPNWSRMFAPQPEILEYLRRTARERGIEGHLRFRTEVQGARWDEDAQLWHVETSRRVAERAGARGCGWRAGRAEVPRHSWACRLPRRVLSLCPLGSRP